MFSDIRCFSRVLTKLAKLKSRNVVVPEQVPVEVRVKKVSWNDVPTIHVYELAEGETLGRRKVQSGKATKVINLADAQSDLIQSVCGKEVVCVVETPTFASKNVAGDDQQNVDLLKALGMM
jgi:hypothetical protein